jgi:hypothetical protein
VLHGDFSATLTIPTLIIGGRQDARVGYDDAISVLPQYPRATVAVLDRAGHAMPTGDFVRAGGKLTPLRRLRFDPPWAVVEASGVLVSLARSLGSRSRRRQCLTWNGGLSCAGSISFAGSRSRS